MKIIKGLRSVKFLQKPIVIDILFYTHLTLGFLISSIIAVVFNIDHTKIAFVWSIIFIYLLIEKTKGEIKK